MVLIDMEMPKRCEECELSSTDGSGFFGCTVKGTIVLRKRTLDKPLWCPLIALPEGHGDLIDRDETMNTILDEPTDAHYPSWYAGIVNDMHAIVPADKEDT